MEQTVEKLLTIQEVCAHLGIKERAFRSMVASGEFPPPVRRNRRWVRIPLSDLVQYQERLTQRRGPVSA